MSDNPSPIETSHADPAVTEPSADSQSTTDTTATVDELDVHNGEPLRPTVVDGNGVERVAGPPVENWQPAQVDPTQEQIDANARFHELEAARRDQAAAILGQTTSEPLAQANADRAAELDAAAADVTDVTPEGGDTTAAPAPPVDTPAPVTPEITGGTSQNYVEQVAATAADADVEARVEADKAAQAAQTAATADAALDAAEATEVSTEEGTS